MTDPLISLKGEHRVIERALHALKGMCLRLEGGKPVEPEALLKLLDFIHISCYRGLHQPAEKCLVRTLLERGVQFKGGPLDNILFEHEVERRLVADLDSSVAAYNRGDPYASQPLINTANHYVDLMSDHIRNEEHVLFDIMSKVFEDQSIALLNMVFEPSDQELGGAACELFERMVTDLERGWAA
ncbi:MAG: hypothetical protein HYR55_15595 [Acidobacteria bacterium]|nr:hypothetical protein [Acidobacteriota bacterium]MBI3656943.1 hypothetical protein [Acidobacteriota bacterium]